MAKASNNKDLSPQLVRASALNLRIAPRKLRLVTNLVKKMYVDEALVQLQHTHKKGALILSKLIKSAVANAKNNFSLKPEDLFITHVVADMGMVMKRYFPRARGSAFVIRRKNSSINIVLEEKKRGKQSGSKISLLKRLTRTNKESAKPQGQDTEKPSETPEINKPKNFRTSEQVKMSKIANKRRLFNRKSGE